jgi:hypothetical protein
VITARVVQEDSMYGDVMPDDLESIPAPLPVKVAALSLGALIVFFADDVLFLLLAKGRS